MKLTDDQLGFIAYRTFYIEERVVVTPWTHLDEGVRECWVAVGKEIRLALEVSILGKRGSMLQGLEEILSEYPGEEGAPS